MNDPRGRPSLTHWLLVPLAAGTGFLCAYILTGLLYTGLAQWCPGGTIESGLCTTSWVNRFPYVFGGGSAAALFIFFGSVVAPRGRRIVVWILFAAGGCAAFPFARGEMLAAIASAAIAGIGTATGLSGAYRDDESPI